jgi:hypothetical protein
MPLIKIDGKEYELDQLSNVAKQQLLSLQFVDGELQRINGQIAVLQTARVSYANALNDALPKAVDMSGLVLGDVTPSIGIS